MEISLSKAYNTYGSSLGRKNEMLTGRCHLVRMALSHDGYDSGGAYWGVGLPLYLCQDSLGRQFFVRSMDREKAKDEILTHYKAITFF